MTTDATARGLAVQAGNDVAAEATNRQNAVQWATPEMFGAVGDGVAIDTAALQAAVDTGLPVRLRPRRTYLLDAEITPPTGAHLFVAGPHKVGDKCATVKAAPGFTGWLLRPKTGYRFENFKIVGNNLDGCYLIGSPDNSTAGLAYIDNIYMSDADIGIYFGGLWEHPWELTYTRINGINFRTGAVSLGGTTETASSGESAWVMSINVNGATGTAGGIAAPSQVVTVDTPSGTFDRLTWDNTNQPLYGWCVMRSADGSTGWHIPPNWTSPGLLAGTFDAQKTAGETWVYQVVRMTRGVHIRRAKAINAEMIQAEYFGVGLYYGDGYAMSVGQFYAETRDRAVPLPQFCGIYARASNINVGGGWVEQFGYGVVSASNSQMSISGPMRANNCKWGRAGQGGSTQQAIRHIAPLISSGTTPSGIIAFAGDANSYIRAGVDQDPTTGAMTSYVDAIDGSGFSVRRRGIDKARMYANTSGEGQVDADRISIKLPSKTHTPPLVNSNQFTALTVGSATAFATISGLPSNTNAGLTFAYLIQIYDGSSVARQTMQGQISVALVSAAGTVAAAVAPPGSPAKAIQTGTISADPVFSASVSAGVVTLSCNATTSHPSARIFLVLTAGDGAGINSLAISQL